MERMSDRATAIRAARRKGFLDGAASIFYLFRDAPPPPPRVQRGFGSLRGDMRELNRDGDRIVSARR